MNKALNSTKDIFEQRAKNKGRCAVIDPNDNVGVRNYYLDKMLQKIILHAIPPTSKSFLDFGCGNGRMCRTLLSKIKNANIFGIDISSKLIEEAKNIEHPYGSRIRYEVIDTKPPYPIPSDFFDIAISCWVTQHIYSNTDLELILVEIARSLKNDGFLLMLERSSEKRQLQSIDTTFYAVMRPHDEVVHLAANAGFSTVSIRPYWIYGRFWQRVINKINKKFWIPFVPFMVQFDLIGKQPFPYGEKRAECFYIFKKRQ